MMSYIQNDSFRANSASPTIFHAEIINIEENNVG